jgi:hypothetical protein
VPIVTTRDIRRKLSCFENKNKKNFKTNAAQNNDDDFDLAIMSSFVCNLDEWIMDFGRT